MTLKQYIKRNKIKCLSCGDIIESTHVHDYKRCKCGKVAVDGGTEYLKRAYPEGNPYDWFVDLSEVQNDISE